MDMSFESRDDVLEGEYLKMVEKKTGVLYAAAAGIGAILAGGNPCICRCSLPFRARDRHGIPDPG